MLQYDVGNNDFYSFTLQLKNQANYKMDKTHLSHRINNLHANYYKVSVHKYGFFLCRTGYGRILLGSRIYEISPNTLCIYTPNSFFQILEKSNDLTGVLEEDDVDTYYPVVSTIEIRKRLQIRSESCVALSDAESGEIALLVEAVYNTAFTGQASRNDAEIRSIHDNYVRHLRYALCLKVLEAYFNNSPVQALPECKEDLILSRFLISLYDNCHKERTVQFYADQQHLSPYYFSTIIKNRSGMGALQWIENVTMTLSREYLECTDLSIKEISEKLNFPDQSTFGRYFKHREGCSPSEFRQSTPEFYKSK